MTLQSHFWVYIQRKWKQDIEEISVPPYLLEALFTIAKTWKQPKSTSMDKWIKMMWCVYTMNYYSSIRKKEILPFLTTWIDLEGIILSEIS